jgi:hypothetical protein
MGCIKVESYFLSSIKEYNMPLSTTRLVQLNDIASKGNDGELGAIAIQLMMVLNDLTLCNHSLGQWKDEAERGIQHRKMGAQRYFIRLLIAHTYEALLLVKSITRRHSDEVERLDFLARKSFDDLIKMTQSDDFVIMERFRNEAAFHYGLKPVKLILKDFLGERGLQNLEVTRSDELIRIYYEPAERVLDRLAVRQILQIPDEEDLRSWVDAIMDRLLSHIEKFSLFADAFIMQQITSR